MAQTTSNPNRTDYALAELHNAALETLATLANAEHERCEHALADSLHHARMAGMHLLQAKERLGYGEWLPWLSDNFNGKPRTAQAYMRVAREWDAVQAANAQSSAYLGYTAALAALAEPKTAEPESVLEDFDQAVFDEWRREADTVMSALDEAGAAMEASDTPLTTAQAERFTSLLRLHLALLREGLVLIAPVWEVVHHEPFSAHLSACRAEWIQMLVTHGASTDVASNFANSLFAEVGS